MAKTFDQSLDEIARLVKHYRTNRAAFHAPGYKEAHARQQRRRIAGCGTEIAGAREPEHDAKVR